MMVSLDSKQTKKRHQNDNRLGGNLEIISPKKSLNRRMCAHLYPMWLNQNIVYSEKIHLQTK